MNMSKSQDAMKAYEIVRALQKRFVDKLDNLSAEFGENKRFQELNWLRNNGIYGGGSRFEARDEVLFNTASVNVSQVHYDEDLNKSLQSATAISTIIHPKNNQYCLLSFLYNLKKLFPVPAPVKLLVSFSHY